MARKAFSILLIFVGFYLLGHYILRWRNQVSVDSQKSTRLVECNPNQIRFVRLTQKDDIAGKEMIFQFERSDTPQEGVPAPIQLARAEWQMVAPGHGEADASVLTRVATMICELYDPILIRGEDWLASESKEKRASTLEFQLSDVSGVTRHEIRFGLVANDRMNLVEYRTDSASKFAKIPPKLLQLASLDEKNYLNLRLMRMPLDSIQVVTVYEKKRERFTLEREGVSWLVKRAGKLVGPGGIEATKFVNRLSTLKGIDIKAASFSSEQCERLGAVVVHLNGVGSQEEELHFSLKQNSLLGCSTTRNTLFGIHQDLKKYLFPSLQQLQSQ